MKIKLFFTFCVFSFFTFNSFSQGIFAGTHSYNATPIAGNVTLFNMSGNLSDQITNSGLGNDYGCVDTNLYDYYAQWVYFKCDQPGNLDFYLGGLGLNYSYIIYGPFASLNNLQNAALNQELGSLSAPIDTCSGLNGMNAPGTVENMSSGDFYLMCVSHDVAFPFEITYFSISGSATLDSSITSNLHAISGKVFYDENENGVFDDIDEPFSNQNVYVNSISSTIGTDQQGNFSMSIASVDSLFYNISTALPSYMDFTTLSFYEFWLDSTINEKDSIYFGFKIDSSVYKGEAQFTAGLINSCMNSGFISINIENNGTLSAGCEIEVTLDSMLIYSSSIPPFTAQSGNTYTFEFDTINFMEEKNITIWTNPDPGLTAFDTVICFLEANFIDSNDITFSTHKDTLLSPVLCSYDPNYKESISSGILNNELILPGDDFTYTIHFQNTGSAPALNVEILDTLSTNLNMSSFEVIGASHNLMTTLDSNRALSFYFENINLPDSLSNEPESHGWISYSISSDSSLVPNENIQNTAFIYFDNNAPIITNTTISIIQCFGLPDSADFTEIGTTLHSGITGSNLSYTWYFNNNLQVGETNSSIGLEHSPGVYHLVVTDQYGCSITFTYDYTASISSYDFTFKVMPNPSNGDFVVMFEQDKTASITLYDESGRQVFTMNSFDSNQLILDGNNLTTGLYILQFTQDNGNVSGQKLIKL